VANTIVYRCFRCRSEGSRLDSFVALPHETPHYTDVCPRCGTEDVEIVHLENEALADKTPDNYYN
jgi:predicted RNA-binding Zn-ribbon protein involved in translation (DUF1610 family)